MRTIEQALHDCVELAYWEENLPEYWDWLDDARANGYFNMFEAPMYMVKEFDELTLENAKFIFKCWAGM